MPFLSMVKMDIELEVYTKNSMIWQAGVDTYVVVGGHQLGVNYLEIA